MEMRRMAAVPRPSPTRFGGHNCAPRRVGEAGDALPSEALRREFPSEVEHAPKVLEPRLDARLGPTLGDYHSRHDGLVRLANLR